MRIHLIGSIPNNDYDRTEEAILEGLKEYSHFFAAAAEIGKIAASRGHTLIVGSDFPLTVDYHAVEKGMTSVIESNPDRTFYLEVWRPTGRSSPFDSLRLKYSNLKIEYFVRRPGFPLEHRSNTKNTVVNTNLWSFAHQSAISNADILIAMGGTTGTERAVYMAEQLGVPVLPISSFGGGAKKSYKSIESSLLNLTGSNVLTADWSLNLNLRVLDLINLAEKIGIHSYFISYSHTHLEWCDLVHLALCSRGRVVLRDRDELLVGRDVQPKLLNAIGKAETFILLWSKQASESQWCKIELQHALNLHKLGLPPRRIVMLRKDDTPPPKELENFLWLEAGSRRETDDSVNKIVSEEFGC